MSLRIATDEHLFLTLYPHEVVQLLFSDTHLDYSDFEHRGRLLDLPDAWTLKDIQWDVPDEVTLVFHLREEEDLT